MGIANKEDLDKKILEQDGEIAALKADVLKLTTLAAESQKAADTAAAAVEAARKAGMSDADKLREERLAFAAEVAAQKDSLKAERRAAAAAKLGIVAKALALVPADIDPGTPEGAAMLERWAVTNPEFVQRGPGAPQPFTPPPTSKLGEFLSGVKKHPYLTAEGFGKLLSGNG